MCLIDKYWKSEKIGPYGPIFLDLLAKIRLRGGILSEKVHAESNKWDVVPKRMIIQNKFNYE